MANVTLAVFVLLGAVNAGRQPPEQVSLATTPVSLATTPAHSYAKDCGMARPIPTALSAHTRAHTKALKAKAAKAPAQYAMKQTSDSSEMRCKGSPATGWGGLGKGVTGEQCEQACLSATSCGFAVFRDSDGSCSEFMTCDMSKDANDAPFSVWERIEVTTTTTTTTTTVVPFQFVLKDGFFKVACVKDLLFYHGDMYGDNRHDYTQGDVSGVSIVHYSGVVAKEDRKEMTHETCFEFCRTVPNMTFFGLIHGRDCYCTPYFKQMAGDSSACDEVCAAKPTQMCGGKTKSQLFEMHECADVASNLAGANKKADNVSAELAASLQEIGTVAEAMQNGAQALQDQFGQAGDPAAADLFQAAKVFAGELQHAAEDKAKVQIAIAAASAEGSKLAGADFKSYEVNEKAQALTVSFQKLTADAEDAVENLQGLLELSSPKDEALKGKPSEQYYSLMYFVDKEFDSVPSTCTGAMFKKPMVDVTIDECASACDKHVLTCTGYSYYPDDKFCFLFSKFTEVTYYTECGKAFLQKAPKAGKSAPTTCYAKLSEYEGTTLAPDPSGKCAGCLKKSTKAARCYK